MYVLRCDLWASVQGLAPARKKFDPSTYNQITRPIYFSSGRKPLWASAANNNFDLNTQPNIFILYSNSIFLYFLLLIYFVKKLSIFSFMPYFFGITVYYKHTVSSFYLFISLNMMFLKYFNF